jgi:hypothetical protein
MFPTTHDITPKYLEAVVKGITALLEANKSILLVSKPHLSCITDICNTFINDQSSIEFRFSIGSLNQENTSFWEPGAPHPDERIQAMQYALNAGFKVSISMEPILADISDAIATYTTLSELSGGVEIWIGKMNYLGFIHHRTENGVNQEELTKRVDLLKSQQSDEQIMKLVNTLKCRPNVKWKDSILKVIAKHN